MDNINFAGEREFCLDYAEGGVASVSASIRKYINKAIKLHEAYPDETQLYVNKDGTVYLQFPAKWIKFPAPPKTMTEENKIKAAERMRRAREKKNEKSNK